MTVHAVTLPGKQVQKNGALHPCRTPTRTPLSLSHTHRHMKACVYGRCRAAPSATTYIRAAPTRLCAMCRTNSAREREIGHKPLTQTLNTNRAMERGHFAHKRMCVRHEPPRPSPPPPLLLLLLLQSSSSTFPYACFALGALFSTALPPSPRSLDRLSRLSTRHCRIPRSRTFECVLPGLEIREEV